MVVLVAEDIRALGILSHDTERVVVGGKSAGYSLAGYDLRIAEDVTLWPGDFKLASTIERFSMPLDVIGIVHDKSSWVREGLHVHNTVIEPGWYGFLTLELKNQHNPVYGYLEHARIPNGGVLTLKAGMPVAQVLFHRTSRPTVGYTGKYQGQATGPQPSRDEETRRD